MLGGWGQAAWFWAAPRSGFAALAAPTCHVDFVTFATGTARTTDQLLDVVAHERRGGRHGSKWTQYEHRFTYDVDGRAREGTSWSRTRLADDRVVVEHLEDVPDTARIVGMGSNERGPTLSLAALASITVAIGCTLWRRSDVELRAARIRERLATAPPCTAHGFLPKVRLDRTGRLVSWSPAAR